MQEKNSFRQSPQTTLIERLRLESDFEGDVDSMRQSFIAEEQTHAAEILAVFTGRGIIPREYRLHGDKLYSLDGESLSEVLDLGINDSKLQILEGKPGAEQELRRREIERHNLNDIKFLNVGFAAVETSAPDLTWTEDERRTQGYSNHTMVRVTARFSDKVFKQFNIILQTADLSVINRCRQLIEPGARDIQSAEEMLANPQIIGLGVGGLEALSKSIEAEYARSSISFSAKTIARTGLGRMLVERRIKKELAKTNSWEYVTAQQDIFNALFDSFVATSMLDKNDWSGAVALIRGGAWYKLIERHAGRDQADGSVSPAELQRSATRAALAKVSFTGCGGTTDMSLVVETSSFIDRLFEVAGIVSDKKGHGRCSACGRKRELVGCYICTDCNKEWCEEYVLTGNMLEIEELAKRVKRKKYRCAEKST